MIESWDEKDEVQKMADEAVELAAWRRI